MKNLKKAAALVLALSLVLMSGMTAYADTGDPDNPAEESPAAIIGDTEYATLDEAVAAAEDGAVVELLRDCTTEGMNLSKNLTIQAAEGVKDKAPAVKFTRYGIALWGKSLTFKDCTVVMKGIGSTPYTAEWKWMTVCASENALLKLDNTTMTMDGTGAGDAHAIYFCSNNKLDIINGSRLEISNYSQDALEWDGKGVYNVNITDSEFVSDHNRSGFTGTFYATIDNSRVDVINSTGNGSNGTNFVIRNKSQVDFSNNGSHGLSAGSLDIDDSEVSACGNGANGIHAAAKMNIHDYSKVTVRENRCSISSKWTIPGAVYVGGCDSCIDGTCDVEITDNEGSGIFIKNGADLDMKTGTVTGNTAVKLGTGGGICNRGAAVLGKAVQLYNNHAPDAGDDIYNEERASITFGKTGSDWKLDGVPNHCTDEITGWFDDAEGSRWKAHGTKPYHTDEFGEFDAGSGMAAVTVLKALKAAHGLIPTDDSSDEWQISKSKEATNLDGNYESKVTLSLPSAQETLSTDVVFVLDYSTSAKVEAQIMTMLQNLQQQVEKTEASVKVGIIIFNKEAHRLCELTPLTEDNLPIIREAIETEIKSGTNLHAGLLAGKAMLDEDTDTAAGRKYLITVSDGITYMFGSKPTVVSWSWFGDSVLSWAGPDNWNSKYNSNEPPAEGWSGWLESIEPKAQVSDYDYPYGETPGKTTPADEMMNYANSIDKALYLSHTVYKAAEEEGYHCYATTAMQEKGETYRWGPSFMEYLADGQDVSFEQIQKEICYLLDAGSYVIDRIGKTGDYNFDLVRPEDMVLRVGEKVYKAQKSESEENVYLFGQPENDVYPYVVRYYPESESNGEEYFRWEINVPVSNLERVSLTYTVRLMNPKDTAGTYGEYDRYGENGKISLYTNNEAVICPVDSEGQPGIPEKFRKPTVSYTVEKENPPLPVYPDYIRLTVQKVWKLDDGGTAADSVKVQLTRNGVPYGEIKTLSADEGWTADWYVETGYDYTVVELDVPEGFTSSVEKTGDIFTVTNDDVKAAEPEQPKGPDDPEQPADVQETEPEQPADVQETEPEQPADVQETEPDQPATGDEAPLDVYAVMLLLACGGAGVLGMRRRQQ